MKYNGVLVSIRSKLGFNDKNTEIQRIVVFPNQQIKNAEFSLKEVSYELIEDSFEFEGLEIINYYLLENNFKDDIDRIYVELEIAEAFLEYYNNTPFINVYIDVSVDMYFRLKKKSDTITIFENLTKVLVESLTKHGFACNDAGALQFRLHLN